MKTLLLPMFFAAAAFLLLAPSPSQSQLPAQTPIQALQGIKAANEELLRRQQATLQQLDVVSEEARQLRIFAKRS